MKILLYSAMVVAMVYGKDVTLNEDQMKDELMERVSHQKRVICNTVASASSMKALAGNFAMTFGRYRRQAGCTGSFGDSCDYSTTSTPFFGKVPSASASIGSLSNILGKRVDSQFFGKANRDIVFVLDSSGSVPDDQFEIAKKAVVTLNSAFCPKQLGHEQKRKQVAVALFSSYVQTPITFKDSHKGEGWFTDRVLGLDRISGGTSTTLALRHVRTNILNGDDSRLNDPNTSTHVIVVTDGHCNSECQNLKDEADKLRNMGPGVQLFALGIGNARACELNLITGNGQEMAFGLDDFTKFSQFAAAVKDEASRHPEKCI